jgi:cyclohexanecarboxyl-CoA dehydrogenase
MLDFDFTPAQQEFRRVLREVALRELLPRYQEGDRSGEYPRDRIRRVLALADDFWRGRESERDLIAAGITAEEIGRGDFSCALPCIWPVITDEILAGAPAELLERWRPSLVSGEKFLGICVTEPTAGSDMGSLRLTATRRGDVYVLDGEKNSVSYLNADLFLVFARTNPSSTDWSGISSFLIPRDTPGLSYHRWNDMGCRATPRGIIRFERVEVSVKAMVAGARTAFSAIQQFFDLNRAYIALKCIGAGQQTIDETADRVKQRETFNLPLSRHQSVAFTLAEAQTLLELGRWLSYRVIWMRQAGHRSTREGAMVKWWVPENVVKVIHDCLILHGHYGYSKDLPIEQRLRDVLGWQIGDGTPQVQKIIIARSLLGKELSPQ